MQDKVARTGLSSRIRGHIQTLGKRSFTPADVARALGEPRPPVHTALRAFLQRGEIERIAVGGYRYRTSEMLHARPARIKPRIFRAMYASSVFTSREIGILSDAKIKLVKKVIWELRRAGSITLVGARAARHGGREFIYRVRHRDEFFLRYIRPRTAVGRRPTGKE